MHTTTDLARSVIVEGSVEARAEHAALFERIVARIHRYFCRLTPTVSDADDCLQRALLLLEESLCAGKFDPGRSFNAWMWLKARTVFAQWVRERQRQEHLREAGGAVVEARPEDPDPEQGTHTQALLRAVQARLGSETYETFLLYYEGGLTQAEVGEVVGRDRKTVRQRVRAAQDLLRALMVEPAPDNDAPLSPPRAE